MNLAFFITAKDGLIVVSLKGELDENSGAILTQCAEETAHGVPRGIVLHFGEAIVGRAGYKEFSLFLRAVKSLGRPVKVSALARETAASLITAGLLATGEDRPTLKEAVEEVAAIIKAKSGASP